MTEQALMERIGRLGQLHLEGNIIPPSWYQHLKYPSGKPYHIAITLLGEIVYWFRPRMVRDEATGEFLGWAKKFRGDGVQRSYAAWGAPFGFTKRESADAIKYLVSTGIITHDIRDVTLPDGTLRPNVVVITDVDPEKLAEITYTRRSGRYTVSPGEVLPRNVLPPQTSYAEPEDLIPEAERSSPDSTSRGDTPSRNCLESNLENILETTLESARPRPPMGETVPTTVPTETGNAAQETTKNAVAATPPAPDKPATSPTGQIPAVLLKPLSRRAVLELGQRPQREDYAYPNVAAACAWVARGWGVPLLLTAAAPDAPPPLRALLETLEGTLASVRERALRARQHTFTRVLDDFLADDEALRLHVSLTLDPLARLAVFADAMNELAAQWDDPPTAADLAALRDHLGDTVAA